MATTSRLLRSFHGHVISKHGLFYIFPGYALRHSTQRALVDEIFNPGPPRRYSIAVSLVFKKQDKEKADNLIHDSFPYTQDNYGERSY